MSGSGRKNGANAVTKTEDPRVALAAAVQLMANASETQRSAFMSRFNLTFGDKRDFQREFGYPSEVTVETYRAWYERGDLAGKIIDLPATTTWRKRPAITAKSRSGGRAFENALQELDDRLRFFHYLERLDRVTGIGRYGVLLIGLGEKDVKKPLVKRKARKVLYLNVFSEEFAKIETFGEDQTNERFGKPEMYKLKLSSENVKNLKRRDIDAHWSHLIHVAENSTETDFLGPPRLQRVFNRLLDLQKVTGGGAELFWLLVAGVWLLTSKAGVTIPEKAFELLEEQFGEAMHGLRRMIAATGAEAHHIGKEPPDPTGMFEVLQLTIAAATNIPVRILFGSERGELASSQDQEEWYARIKARQEQFAEPVILRPTIDRLIEYGALPRPSKGYDVTWPPLDEPDIFDRAEAAKNVSDALRAYVGQNGDPSQVIPLWELRESIFGLSGQPPEPPEGMKVEPTEDAIEPVTANQAEAFRKLHGLVSVETAGRLAGFNARQIAVLQRPVDPSKEIVER